MTLNFFASTQHTRKQFFWWKSRELFLEKWFILSLLDWFLLGFSKNWLFEVEKLVLFFIFGHIVRLFMLSHANRVYLWLSQRWMYFRVCSVCVEILLVFYSDPSACWANAEVILAMTESTQNDFSLGWASGYWKLADTEPARKTFFRRLSQHGIYFVLRWWFTDCIVARGRQHPVYVTGEWRRLNIKCDISMWASSGFHAAK